MMKIKHIVLCILLVFVGCQRDEEMEIGQISVSNERLEASYSSVEISCSFQTNVTIKNVQAYLSTEADFSSAKPYSLTEKSKNTFGATIEGLKDASTYYVRYEVSNRWSSKMIDEVSEFKTIPYTIPTVQTSEVSDVTRSTAIVGGVITENGGQEITERGVVYSKSPNPSIVNGTKIESLEKAESYACTLMDLEYVTTYYARAYAINALGVGYGNEVSFTTMACEVLQITIANPTKYSVSTATIDCEVTFDGGLEVTERGVCYSTTSNPTYSSSKVESGSGLGVYSCELSNLSENTTYYVRAYAKNAEAIGYSREVSFTTRTRTYMDGYEYVDLGLSVKWATMNVGASSPEDYGDYFAWGETEPKEVYNWSTYKHCQGSETTLTKYNTESTYGTVDNKTELDAIDDAAVVNWGGSWRMPTTTERNELYNNCTWSWTTQNGVMGYKVTSKSNGNSIFLPAAGYRGVNYANDKEGSSLHNAGSNGYYWSSSISGTNPYDAWGVNFGSSFKYLSGGYRYDGRSVRPVCP